VIPSRGVADAAACLLALAVGWGLSGWARRVCDSDSRWLRGWVVGALSALFSGTAILAAHSWWEMPAFWALGVFSGLLIASDLAVMRLPDPIMVWAYPVFFALLIITAAGLGEWGRLGRALLAGLALLVFYLVTALVFPNGMSLGDVKYAGILGAFLGWGSWLHVLWGALLAALLGGIVGVVLLATKRGDRTTEYAYGPMMAVGALVAGIWLR